MRNGLKRITTRLVVLIALALISCEKENTADPAEELSAVYKRAFLAPGFTDGPLDEYLNITLEFNHPDETYGIREIKTNVIDEFHTEFTLVAAREEFPRDSPGDSVLVAYYISAAGTHQSSFFYQLGNSGERRPLGIFSFSINN